MKPKIHNVSFSDSFKKCGYETNNATSLLYNANYLNYDQKFEQRIPKIFHYIWFGELPEKQKALVETWKVMNPSWEFKFWNEESSKNFPLVNKHVFDNTKNLAVKSDILRLEVLYRYGGVYADADFLHLQSFDDFTYLKFFTGHPDTDNIAAGLIGCNPNNEIIKHVIDTMSSVKSPPNSIPSIMAYGPQIFSRQILDGLNKFDTDLAVLFPPSFFYPFPGRYREFIRHMSPQELIKFMKDYTHMETHSIHLWYCSWQ